MAKAKVSRPYTAQGREDAPYLFVLDHVPTDGLWAWFVQTLLDNRIDILDCRFVFQHDEAPQGANGAFLKEQTRKAWPRFSTEVRASSPRVVLPVGPVTMRALTGIHEDIAQARGYLITSQFFRNVEHDEWTQVGTYVNASKATGAQPGDPKMRWVTKVDEPLLTRSFAGYVIPMFRLDFIAGTQYSCMAAVNADLDRAYRAVNNELEMVDDGFRYETALTDAVLYHKWDDLIAVDIETHGVANEVIDCVSFSDGLMTATIPWTVEAREFMSALFARPNTIFALHNSPFDLPRLRQAGVVITQETMETQVFDTMFGGVIIQPDLMKGLGAMSSVHLDVAPWKWRSISMMNPQFYSAKDSYVTVLLARKLISIMKDLGCWDLFMGRGACPGPGVMATLPMLTESSRIGIRVNRPFAKAWTKRLNKHLLTLLKMWNKHFAGYNPFSNPDMKRLFYTEWNLPIQRNPKEGISVDELSCMKLKNYTLAFAGHPAAADEGWTTDPRFGHRVFELLIVIRQVSKSLGTYAQPIAEGTDTRVYPQYLPSAKDNEHTSESKSKGNTATGRLVAYGLNIQNQGKYARGMYLPDTDEMCFLQADYVRAEPTTMAWSAGDEAMKADLASGDLYTALAQRVLALAGVKVTRKICKSVFLASQYLAGAPKVSDMILKSEHVYIDPATCKLIQRITAEAYHAVAALKQWLITQCHTAGYIRNPFGRVRTFYDDRAASAVDFWPQSIVGDIMWCVMLLVHRAAQRYGGRFVLQVHDSIVVQVPQRHMAAMARDMRDIMSRTFDCVAPGFHIPVDFEAAGPGQAWGEVKPYVLEHSQSVA